MKSTLISGPLGARRETEHYARVMTQGLPASEDRPHPVPGLSFNTEEEQAMVNDVFESALAGLNESDRNLGAVKVPPPDPPPRRSCLQGS